MTYHTALEDQQQSRHDSQLLAQARPPPLVDFISQNLVQQITLLNFISK